VVVVVVGVTGCPVVVVELVVVTFDATPRPVTVIVLLGCSVFEEDDDDGLPRRDKVVDTTFTLVATPAAVC